MPADDISGNGNLPHTQATEPTSRRRGAAAVAVLLLLLLITCCGIGLSQMGTVPDVIGMTEDEARAALEEAGFEAEIVSGDEGADSAGSSTLVVISQSPEPGGRFLRGTRVRLTLGQGSSDGSSGGTKGSGVSSGSSLPPASGGSSDDDDGYAVVPGASSGAPDRRPVIPMVGNTAEASAIATLQNAGYRVAVKYGPSTAGIVEGNVYAQQPAFGSRADRGTLVTLWVSTGAPHEDGYEGVPYPGPGY